MSDHHQPPPPSPPYLAQAVPINVSIPTLPHHTQKTGHIHNAHHQFNAEPHGAYAHIGESDGFPTHSYLPPSHHARQRSGQHQYQQQPIIGSLYGIEHYEASSPLPVLNQGDPDYSTYGSHVPRHTEVASHSIMDYEQAYTHDFHTDPDIDASTSTATLSGSYPSISPLSTTGQEETPAWNISMQPFHQQEGQARDTYRYYEREKDINDSSNNYLSIHRETVRSNRNTHNNYSQRQIHTEEPQVAVLARLTPTHRETHYNHSEPQQYTQTHTQPQHAHPYIRNYRETHGDMEWDGVAQASSPPPFSSSSPSYSPKNSSGANAHNYQLPELMSNTSYPRSASQPQASVHQAAAINAPSPVFAVASIRSSPSNMSAVPVAAVAFPSDDPTLLAAIPALEIHSHTQTKPQTPRMQHTRTPLSARGSKRDRELLPAQEVLTRSETETYANSKANNKRFSFLRVNSQQQTNTQTVESHEHRQHHSAAAVARVPVSSPSSPPVLKHSLSARRGSNSHSESRGNNSSEFKATTKHHRRASTSSSNLTQTHKSSSITATSTQKLMKGRRLSQPQVATALPQQTQGVLTSNYTHLPLPVQQQLYPSVPLPSRSLEQRVKLSAPLAASMVVHGVQYLSSVSLSPFPPSVASYPPYPATCPSPSLQSHCQSLAAKGVVSPSGSQSSTSSESSTSAGSRVSVSSTNTCSNHLSSGIITHPGSATATPTSTPHSIDAVAVPVLSVFPSIHPLHDRLCSYLHHAFPSDNAAEWMDACLPHILYIHEHGWDEYTEHFFVPQTSISNESNPQSTPVYAALVLKDSSQPDVIKLGQAETLSRFNTDNTLAPKISALAL